LDRRLGGAQTRSGRGVEEKNSQPLPGLEPPIIQPEARRFTTEISRLLGETLYCEISSHSTTSYSQSLFTSYRVDAAKHMWPEDLQYIYSQIDDLSVQHGFAPNTRPFIYQEVIDYGKTQ
jgi:hypothetical protein